MLCIQAFMVSYYIVPLYKICKTLEFHSLFFVQIVPFFDLSVSMRMFNPCFDVLYAAPFQGCPGLASPSGGTVGAGASRGATINVEVKTIPIAGNALSTPRGSSDTATLICTSPDVVRQRRLFDRIWHTRWLHTHQKSDRACTDGRHNKHRFCHGSRNERGACRDRRI